MALRNAYLLDHFTLIEYFGEKAPVPGTTGAVARTTHLLFRWNLSVFPLTTQTFLVVSLHISLEPWLVLPAKVLNGLTTSRNKRNPATKHTIGRITRRFL